MNREERLARAYLESLQAGEVLFEPLGRKKVPDFSLDGCTGVEVRRLNENYFGGEQIDGLEQVDIPVWKSLEKAIESFEGTPTHRSYWVGVEFERPLETRGKKLRRDMRSALANALPDLPSSPQSWIALNVRDGLRLLLYPAGIASSNPFMAAASLDVDGGGMVTRLYITNIKHSIADKSSKVHPVRKQYNGWWLLLIDTINHSLPDHEMAEVKQALTDLGIFARVILLDYHGRKSLLDLDTNN